MRTEAEGLRVAIVDTSPLYPRVYRIYLTVHCSSSKSITTHPPKGEQRRVNEARCEKTKDPSPMRCTSNARNKRIQQNTGTGSFDYLAVAS